MSTYLLLNYISSICLILSYAYDIIHLNNVERCKNMSDTKDKLIGQAGGVLEKAYDDVVHPSAKSIGNSLSLLPRAIGVCLGKLEKWVINGEESIRLTAEAVQQKVLQIPEEKLTEPEQYVAIPTIQQLSYCYDSEELREMYANLLVSSMNTDTKYQVHPSFVDIIKQLTPDEAKLLKKLSKGNSFPLIDVNRESPSGGYQVIVHNFTDISEDVCDCPSNVFAYLDNFERLKLIDIKNDKYLTNDDFYKPLENHVEIQEIMSHTLPEGYKNEITKGMFKLTAFGREFIKICLS